MDEDRKKVLLLLDNASCHKTNIIKAWAYKEGVEVSELESYIDCPWQIKLRRFFEISSTFEASAKALLKFIIVKKNKTKIKFDNFLIILINF